MALEHARAGQLIDVRPLGARLGQSVTSTLIKTPRLEVIRLILPAGKEIPHHQVPGEILVQCLEGAVTFLVGSQSQVLGAGQMLYLQGNELHALRGVEDASVLVTILLNQSS